mmetsp:Transcript_80333/g.152715  ORF Transcript_80333/g.152715 Transcript_80333/m.152715 type:complete len:232 (-) Transcript_80333:91-786(-)
MPAGLIAGCPSIEEASADTQVLRQRIADLRERNATLFDRRSEMANKVQSHKDRRFHLERSLVDLKDRGKFMLVASNKNPGPIAQYAPNLSAEDPPEHYAQSNEKVKRKAFGMLHDEATRADKTKAPPPVKRRTEPVTPGHVVANFSPFQGDTLNSVRKLPDNVLLGLRSPTHAKGMRRPPMGRLLSNMWEGEGRARRGETASYLALRERSSPARNRNHITTLIRGTSSPAL